MVWIGATTGLRHRIAHEVRIEPVLLEQAGEMVTASPREHEPGAAACFEGPVGGDGRFHTAAAAG